MSIKFYTQHLSDHLRTLSIEGFLYEFVQNGSQKCLCIFPDKLLKGSSLTVVGKYKEIESKEMFIDGTL